MRKKTRALLLGGLFALSSVMIGCSSNITEQQLQQIQDLRKQQAQLQESIRKREADIAALRTEIQSRQRDLDKCEEKKRFIKEKLKNWPNVWPD